MHEVINQSASVPDGSKPQYPADQPIGDREMTKFEVGNMNLAGLPEHVARTMTPAGLADHADAIADSTHCHTLLGC